MEQTEVTLEGFYLDKTLLSIEKRRGKCENRSLCGGRMSILRRLTTKRLGLDNESEDDDKYEAA
jgi:hypothetical protein